MNELASIPVFTLIAHGDDDQIVHSQTSAGQAAKAIKNNEYYIIKADHMGLTELIMIN